MRNNKKVLIKTFLIILGLFILFCICCAICEANEQVSNLNQQGIFSSEISEVKNVFKTRTGWVVYNDYPDQVFIDPLADWDYMRIDPNYHKELKKVILGQESCYSATKLKRYVVFWGKLVPEVRSKTIYRKIFVRDGQWGIVESNPFHSNETNAFFLLVPLFVILLGIVTWIFFKDDSRIGLSFFILIISAMSYIFSLDYWMNSLYFLIFISLGFFLGLLNEKKNKKPYSKTGSTQSAEL